MGQLRFDEKYLCRGWSKKFGAWVYGNFVEMCIDSVIHAYIYRFPRNANSGNHANTPDPIEVDRETVGRFTGLTDYAGNRIYEGEHVMTPTGQRGTVRFELGTWGIALEASSISEAWNYDRLEELVPYNNTPRFIWNDCFISFYELIDNLCSEDAYDDHCSVVYVLPEEPEPDIPESYYEFLEFYDLNKPSEIEIRYWNVHVSKIKWKECDEIWSESLPSEDEVLIASGIIIGQNESPEDIPEEEIKRRLMEPVIMELAESYDNPVLSLQIDDFELVDII